MAFSHRPSTRGSNFRRLVFGSCILSSVALALPAVAEDISALAARLATLRGEVEELAQRLNTKTTETKETLRSLSRQRSDLELEVKREEVRLQKIHAAIAKRKAEIAAEKAKGDRLVPLYEESFRSIRGSIDRSLPFRKEERLAALDKIQEQYKTGLLTPARALQRLWSFIEDELRMTRESGLYKQTIQTEGEERLAEVIRIGMVMLFYKTDDGEVGKLKKRDGQWLFEPVDNPEQQRLVMDLFTSFKKQIRVGYFELPYALVDSVNSKDVPFVEPTPHDEEPARSEGSVSGEPAASSTTGARP